ncbi:hypothetical protein RMHFA_05715 (plasmid) [Roseomonas mucosa]|uniref:hypothetical protein n=1 Tax=Roseomonas mucosa TaxID=207340 RepID=UPI002246A44F|nr:hypothetical protein [Roseomonas mucosa]UZO95020.1 hypothetical protein RMHFA_05715 [Roseomonas mucosa]
MTTNALDGVALLIPRRFHQDRERVVHAMLSDLSATIRELPTAFRPGSLVDADADGARAWALGVIQALPTRKGDVDDGNC